MSGADRRGRAARGERRGPWAAARAWGGRAALALAVAVTAWRGFTYARAWRGLDYFQFWAVGRAVARSGGADVYSEEGRKRIGAEVVASLPRDEASRRLAAAASRRTTLETYSTPFLYTVAGAAATGDYDRDHAAFVVASLLLGLGGVLILCRLLRFPPLATAAVVLLLELYAPYRSDLRVGNVNLIQLGLLAAFLGVSAREPRSWRDPAAGAILGAAALFKPNLALVAVTVLAGWAMSRAPARAVRAAAGMVASSLAALAASSAYFGAAGAWRSWLAAILSLPSEIVPVRTGNFSLVRLLAGDAGARLAPVLAAAIVSATAAVLWLRRRRAPASDEARGPRGGAGEDVALVGLGCMAYLLSSPLVWIHYFVLAIPLALWLLRPRGAERARHGLAVSAAAAVALLLLANRPLEAIVGQGHPALVAATSIAGAVALLALALLELGGLRPAARDEGATAS